MRKILYFDCAAGISGDMTLGALLHLGADFGRLKGELSKLGVGGYELIKGKGQMNGIVGVNLDVAITGGAPGGDGGPGQGCGPGHDSGHAASHSRSPGDAGGHSHSHGPGDAGGHGHSHGPGDAGGHSHSHGPGDAGGHSHSSFKSISEMIKGSALGDRVKRMSLSVFAAIAQAEAAVHGMAVGDVVFHEVGAVDSIVDIVGTAICIDDLGAERIMCSPVHDGHGTIMCRHGMIPVPVPAVAEMLKGSGISIVGEDVATEMVTPTGLGILKGLGAECALIPEMRVLGVGYGFGKRDTGRFNALRVILGVERATGA
jgi:uncharacterized protein (DUF111 family)